jgi:hypothetical protein
VALQKGQIAGSVHSLGDYNRVQLGCIREPSQSCYSLHMSILDSGSIVLVLVPGNIVHKGLVHLRGWGKIQTPVEVCHLDCFRRDRAS